MTEKETPVEPLLEYPPTDIRYWEALAEQDPNNIPNYEDDAEYVDEDGVVIKELRPN